MNTEGFDPKKQEKVLVVMDGEKKIAYTPTLDNKKFINTCNYLMLELKNKLIKSEKLTDFEKYTLILLTNIQFKIDQEKLISTNIVNALY